MGENNRISREEVIEKLVELQESNDTEKAHGEADDLLCQLLDSLGFKDVVNAYIEIEKWYA